jgi:hypothetical protein
LLQRLPVAALQETLPLPPPEVELELLLDEELDELELLLDDELELLELLLELLDEPEELEPPPLPETLTEKLLTAMPWPPAQISKPASTSIK